MSVQRRKVTESLPSNSKAPLSALFPVRTWIEWCRAQRDWMNSDTKRQDMMAEVETYKRPKAKGDTDEMIEYCHITAVCD